MELAAEVPRMFRQFTNFDVHAVRRLTREAETVRGEFGLEFAIEFVAMAMALTDLGRPIGLLGETAGRGQTRIRAQAHGAAELVDTLQLTELINDAVQSGGIEFGGIRIG